MLSIMCYGFQLMIEISISWYYTYSKYPSKSNSCKIELVQGIVTKGVSPLEISLKSTENMEIQPLNSQVHALVAWSLGHSIW